MKALLLKDLLESGADGLLLQEWGKTHEVSELALLAQIKLWEDAGFVFSWKDEKCQLTSTPPNLSLDYLIHLGAALPIKTFFHESLDSTNAQADRLRADEPPPFFVGALRQTAGRGRMGKPWYSGTTQNYYFSLGFSSKKKLEDMRLYTLWMGVYLADFLRRTCAIDVQVKWPNDLYVRGKKLGGILTEAKQRDAESFDYIFGVGLNVGLRAEDFPAEIASLATSLVAEGARVKNINQFAIDWLAAIWKGTQEYQHNFSFDHFMSLWQQLDFLYGRTIMVHQAKGDFSATSLGIEPSGGLLVKDTQGVMHTLHGGEVSLSV